MTIIKKVTFLIINILQQHPMGCLTDEEQTETIVSYSYFSSVNPLPGYFLTEALDSTSDSVHDPLQLMSSPAVSNCKPRTITFLRT